MPSTTCSSNRPAFKHGRDGAPAAAGLRLCAPALALALLAGCARVPNQFREDGPSVSAEWDSPTAQSVKNRVQPPTEQPHRDWRTTYVAAESGAIQHEPLYFEDPFEDKGDGRTDQTDPHNVYRLGWEDYVAFPYCFARYTANWLLLPVSAIVTPPWTTMESDGELSRQLLGYDHDAERVTPQPPLFGKPAPAEPPAQPAAPAGSPETDESAAPGRGA